LVIVVALALEVSIIGRSHGLIAGVSVVLLVLTSVGYGYLLRAYVEKEEPDKILARVEIDTPRDGATVKDCVDVEGTFNFNLDSDERLWVVVTPGTGYYLQDPAMPLGGRWRSRACFWSQDRYSVLAVVAKPGIHALFEDIRNRCRSTQHCPSVDAACKEIRGAGNCSIVDEFFNNPKTVQAMISVNAQAPTPPTPTASPSPVSG
jgi:hypothetical protein